jgi:hypothetical protein
MRNYSMSRNPYLGRRTLMAVATLVALAELATSAHAIELPSFSLRRGDCVTVAGLNWHTDYVAACDDAQIAKKILLVNFVPRDTSDAQRGFEKFLQTDKAVRAELKDYVLVRVDEDERAGGMLVPLRKKNRDRLIDDAAFKHLGRKPGLAMLDFRNAKDSYYGDVVTVLPFANGKYYRWKNSQFAVALDLPAGTITQRMMVWAVRIHPEKPQSTVGTMHPELIALATKHSEYQARIGVQGHQHFETRAQTVRFVTQSNQVSEVVAESWENQDLIDSSIDCVLSWRQSPGHWAGVRSRHRLYGYDIRQGTNGIWYGTGLFAN